MKSTLAGVMVGVLALLIVSAGGAYSQGPAPAGGTAPEAVVTSTISYQGRLVNPGTGAPLNGIFGLEFSFWNASAGGTQLGAPISRASETIANGLYATGLTVDPTLFNGQVQWLEVRVRPGGGSWETLAPRVQILPTPYALSLRPGAQIQGDATTWTDGYVVAITMTGAYPLASAVRGGTATGYAVKGVSAGGFGVAGYTDDGYAVYGNDGGATTARGYGGYFTSLNGVGVYGYSSAASYWTNQYAPGVYGSSANGVGVYGVGATTGVRGDSPGGTGVYGTSKSGDARNDAGVWGYIGSSTGTAVRGSKYGTSGYAVLGTNTGTSGSGVAGESVNWTGVWGESTNDIGVYGVTGAASHNYGLYTPDNLHALNYVAAGAMMQVVQNGGDVLLQPGDVASFSGMALPIEKGGQPIIKVARTSSAGSTAVAGVVSSRYDYLAASAPRTADGTTSTPVGPEGLTPPGPVAPGEYMLLVVQGPTQVNASALTGSIRPGDLLASASVAGYAAKAASVGVGGVSVVAPGTVLGKALEPLDAEARAIYMYVTLQ